MEESFDENYSKDWVVNENALLTSIWFNPTKTLETIIEYYPDKYVTSLLVLGGIVRAIDRAAMKEMGDSVSTSTILVFAILLGGLFGWITYYIYAWGMSVTGKLLNGKADPAEFRTVIAWALIPTICSLIFLIPKAVIFGDDLFKSEITDDSPLNNLLWIIFGIIEITLSIWTFIILVKGISIVQGFKLGKSILNMVLPGLFIVVPLVVFALLYQIIN